MGHAIAAKSFNCGRRDPPFFELRDGILNRYLRLKRCCQRKEQGERKREYSHGYWINVHRYTATYRIMANLPNIFLFSITPHQLYIIVILMNCLLRCHSLSLIVQVSHSKHSADGRTNCFQRCATCLSCLHLNSSCTACTACAIPAQQQVELLSGEG